MVCGSGTRGAGSGSCRTVFTVAVTSTLLQGSMAVQYGRDGGGSRRSSVQVLDRPIDVPGQVERVVAHQALSELGVTRLDRFDDLPVIDDRALGAAIVSDRAAPDRPDVDEQAFGHARDHRG